MEDYKDDDVNVANRSKGHEMFFDEKSFYKELMKIANAREKRTEERKKITKEEVNYRRKLGERVDWDDVYPWEEEINDEHEERKQAEVLRVANWKRIPIEEGRIEENIASKIVKLEEHYAIANVIINEPFEECQPMVTIKSKAQATVKENVEEEKKSAEVQSVKIEENFGNMKSAKEDDKELEKRSEESKAKSNSFMDNYKKGNEEIMGMLKQFIADRMKTVYDWEKRCQETKNKENSIISNSELKGDTKGENCEKEDGYDSGVEMNEVIEEKVSKKETNENYESKNVDLGTMSNQEDKFKREYENYSRIIEEQMRVIEKQKAMIEENSKNIKKQESIIEMQERIIEERNEKLVIEITKVQYSWKKESRKEKEEIKEQPKWGVVEANWEEEITERACLVEHILHAVSNKKQKEVVKWGVDEVEREIVGIFKHVYNIVYKKTKTLRRSIVFARVKKRVSRMENWRVKKNKTTNKVKEKMREWKQRKKLKGCHWKYCNSGPIHEEEKKVSKSRIFWDKVDFCSAANRRKIKRKDLEFFQFQSFFIMIKNAYVLNHPGTDHYRGTQNVVNLKNIINQNENISS